MATLLLSFTCCVSAQSSEEANPLPTVKDENETLARVNDSMDEPDMDELMMFFSLPSINFVIGKSEVLQTQEASLKQVASYMKDNPTSSLTVVGYSDSTSTNEASAILLATNRAKAVVQSLSQMGIATERLRIESKKEPASTTPNNADLVTAVAFSVDSQSK